MRVHCTLSVIVIYFCTQFFQQVEVWQDECQSKDIPPDIPTAEEALAHHDQLKETCQSLYVSVRTECHKIVEKLRIPVGDSSLPKGFVMGTRHVKEILESLVDEKNWIDEQWALRRLVLFQTLNLRKFQQEAKKVSGCGPSPDLLCVGVVGVI